MPATSAPSSGEAVQSKGLVLHVRDGGQLGRGHVVIPRRAHKRAQRPEEAIIPDFNKQSGKTVTHTACPVDLLCCAGMSGGTVGVW